jgi:putative membrane protein
LVSSYESHDMNLLIAWVINAAVLLGLPYVLPQVQMKGFTTALIAALVLGLLNTIIRPILLVLTLPVNFITLGLFTFVINGLMFWLAARLLDGFSVDGFGWAIIAALIYSLITWAIGSLLLRPKKAQA